MSHFAVAVFTNKRTTVEELLEPYDEGLAVDKYLQYTKAQLIENARRELEEIRTTTYAEYLKNPTAYLEKVCHGDAQNKHYQFLSSEFIKRYNETDEQILQRELSYYEDDMQDQDGNVYSTYNPDSKWDWYVCGGRFSDMLIDLDSEGKADELPVRKVDFIEMSRMERESMAPYEKAINDGFYKPEYLKRMYPNEEIYEKIQTTFWTRAVVTPDGEWHEVGKMGWFGCSSEEPEETTKWVDTYYDRFLAKAIENDWDIHIIDCHI